jgi:hypothetical protein
MEIKCQKRTPLEYKKKNKNLYQKKQITMEKQKMIEVLQFCAAQCAHCYDACRLEKGMDMSTCMMYVQDCADLCRLTAQLLERKSENADIFLKTTLVMCERGASECAKHPQMEHCRKCAEACRKCAEMCHEHEMAHRD